MAKPTNKPKPAPQDWHLWREVVRTVNPLPRKPMIIAAKRGKKSGPPKAVVAKTPAIDISTRYYSAPWSPGTGARSPVPGASPSVIEPRLHRKLRRGQLPIQGSIDLHGMRQDEARLALFGFIKARAGRGARTVLVITGKGIKKTGHEALAERGVLRHMLPRWLGEPEIKPMIAGWEVSARRHGGEGAFYVRLKRMAP